MPKWLNALKVRAVQLHETIKALDEMPMRMIQGEFYEEKKAEVRVPRKTKVSVEDLRPKR